MRYSHIIAFFFALILCLPAKAQLGTKEKKLISRYKKRNVVQKMRARRGFHEIMFKIDRDLLLVVRIREEDTRAVMLNYSKPSPSIDSTFYAQAVEESFRDFLPEIQYTSQDDYERRTCLYNSDKSQLVMRIHGQSSEDYPP